MVAGTFAKRDLKLACRTLTDKADLLAARVPCFNYGDDRWLGVPATRAGSNYRYRDQLYSLSINCLL